MRQSAIVHGVRVGIVTAVLLIVAAPRGGAQQPRRRERSQAGGVAGGSRLGGPGRRVALCDRESQAAGSGRRPDVEVPLCGRRPGPDTAPARRLRFGAIRAPRARLPRREHRVGRQRRVSEHRHRVAADPSSALDRLKQRFAVEEKPGLRARLAITLLHLGDTAAAQAVLALGPDPSQRTAFIHGLETWHGDPADYVEPLRTTQDSAFRSGLSLAVGRIPAQAATAAKQGALRCAAGVVPAGPGRRHAQRRGLDAASMGDLAAGNSRGFARRPPVVCQLAGPDDDQDSRRQLHA